MNFKGILVLGVITFALLGVVLLSGCCKKPEAGPAEKAGAALDDAVEKTGDAAKKLLDKAKVGIKDAADKTAKKTGEVLEKAGDAIEKTGEDLQDKQ